MLNNKTALITGASRGIGRAIALKYASLGADIVLNYNSNVNSAMELSEEINKMGRRTLIVSGDVSIYEDAKNIVEKAKQLNGNIDILVNNAGITRDGLLLRMKEEDFDKVISVNLKGAFNCCKHVAPIMLKQKSGRIINIASVVGITGNAGQSNYAAAKAGIIGFTKSVAKELASRNITVNAIAPGFINTDMTDSLNDKVKDAILASIPLKRFGQGEDVANVAAFLASELSTYVTGQIINVDGGMVM